MGFDWACVESIDQFVENQHLNNTESSDPQTWYTLDLLRYLFIH